MKRWLYEQFNMNIYIIVPAITSFFIFCYQNYTGVELFKSELLNNYSVEISLSILATLFTVLSLFAALPQNKYRQLMKKYHHDRIIVGTLFFGIVAAICSLIVFISGELLFIQQYLFTIMLTETCISTYWMAQTIRHSNATS